MAKHNAANERIKRRYFSYLTGAHGRNQATVDAVAKSLARFEEYTRAREFAKFRLEQAAGFRVKLSEERNARTGAPLSKATMLSTLRDLRAFFFWLADKPGFKSQIQHRDADYFNLSSKDVAIAQARREKTVPSIAQVERVLQAMPVATALERRDRALIAFAAITCARVNALASFRLGHVNLAGGYVEQDARTVRTKFAKTFRTFFMPVCEGALEIVTEWIGELEREHLWGPADPLFPATRMGLGEGGGFAALGLARHGWATTSPIRDIFKRGFAGADLPYYNPHSFRDMLVRHAMQLNLPVMQLRAWSLNLGHSDLLTTLTSYGTMPVHQQGELIRAFGKPAAQLDPVDPAMVAQVVAAMQKMAGEPLDVGTLPAEAQSLVRVERLEQGERLHIAAEATPAVAEAIAAEVARRQPDGKAKAAAILDWQAVNDARRAPAGLGVRFAPIPQMRVLVQGDLELLDSQTLIDLAGWTLADSSPSLDAHQFDFDETAQVFRFDLDGEALSYTIGARDVELALDYGAAWDAARLASWLTMALDQRDRWHSSHSALLEFNRRVVADLLERRGLPLGKLARGRYLLKRAVEQRIRASRLAAAGRGQQTLFALPDDVVVTPDAAFHFDPLVNPATSFYEGAWTPSRCYYSRVGKMNGDELECAQALDSMAGIVRHWVRNGDQGQHAFSLPLAGGNFFPDFVAELDDARVFVVEHKGAHLVNDPGELEKDLVGQHWAKRSLGRCRFVMVTQDNNGPTLGKKIASALA